MSTLTIIGSAMIAAGLFFAVRHIALDSAGGSALKGIALSGPAWLVLIGMGVGMITFDRWIEQSETKTVEDREVVVPPTEPPLVEEADLFPGGWTYGDNAALDELWEGCERGVWLSCDDLYFQADADSDYEWFGASCGYLIEDPVAFCDESNN